jgi:hypothetical protein
MWRIWSLALGRKDGRDDREADIIAGIRTLILVCYMVTNVAIVANAVRHWNDGQCDDTTSGTIPLTLASK